MVGGHGVGTSEYKMTGPVTLEPSIAACHELKKSNPEINGISIWREGCYCEESMNTVGSHSKYKTCQLIEKVKNKTGMYAMLLITVENCTSFYNFIRAAFRTQLKPDN